MLISYRTEIAARWDFHSREDEILLRQGAKSLREEAAWAMSRTSMQIMVALCTVFALILVESLPSAPGRGNLLPVVLRLPIGINCRSSLVPSHGWTGRLLSACKAFRSFLHDNRCFSHPKLPALNSLVSTRDQKDLIGSIRGRKPSITAGAQRKLVGGPQRNGYRRGRPTVTRTVRIAASSFVPKP